MHPSYPRLYREWLLSPLKFVPPPYFQKNNKSTELRHMFVDEAVLSLLSQRCVAKVEQRPLVCSLLSVVTNSEGKFLICTI